jgi:hypothetical protein
LSLAQRFQPASFYEVVQVNHPQNNRQIPGQVPEIRLHPLSVPEVLLVFCVLFPSSSDFDFHGPSSAHGKEFPGVSVEPNCFQSFSMPAVSSLPHSVLPSFVSA